MFNQVEQLSSESETKFKEAEAKDDLVESIGTMSKILNKRLNHLSILQILEKKRRPN